MPPLSMEAIAAAATTVVQLSTSSSTPTERSTQPETSALRSHIPPLADHDIPHTSTTASPTPAISSISLDSTTATSTQASRVAHLELGPPSTPSSPPLHHNSSRVFVPTASPPSVNDYPTQIQTQAYRSSQSASPGPNHLYKSRRLSASHASASASASTFVLPRFTSVNYSSTTNPPLRDPHSATMSTNQPAPRAHGRSLSLSHAPSRARTALPDLPTGLGSFAITAGGHLMHLSQMAALQDKISESSGAAGYYTNGNGHLEHSAASRSRKRSADGFIKSDRSLKRYSHSRNHSTVSLGSASVEKIGELSAELRTRLSYAMMKVNHGWQSHSIDEVESLASQAVSPSSTTSTPRRRPDSATSPALSSTGMSIADLTATPASQDTRSQPSPPAVSAKPNVNGNPVGLGLGLAPPATIQPSPRQFPPSSFNNSSAHSVHPRRHSRAGYTPTLLSQHSLPLSSPQTPSSAFSNRRLSCSQLSSRHTIMFSPHQNVREQDAIETLLFMSSPGYSANLKNSYVGPLASPRAPATTIPGQVFGSLSGSVSAPPSQLQFSHANQPQTQSQPSPRHALPNSQPRKTLPSHRPALTGKRVGFDGMISEEGPVATRRKTAGGVSAAGQNKMQFTLPLALDRPLQVRQWLADEDIDRMLERVAAEESDDDEEIQIPNRMMPRVQVV